MNLPFKVICLDDSNRPESIPTSKWIKKGESYTVIKIGKLLIQNGLVGFKLQEVNIDDCYPYQFFSAKRFGIPTPDKWIEEELERLLKEAQEEVKELNTYYSE